MSKFTPPRWLQGCVFVIHLHADGNTIFQPQRRITFQDGKPHLLDLRGTLYPLGECAPLKIWNLTETPTPLVTEGSVLTVYRARRPGEVFVVTDGIRSVGLRVPAIPVEQAAASLATCFHGQITITESSHEQPVYEL